MLLRVYECVCVRVGVRVFTGVRVRACVPSNCNYLSIIRGAHMLSDCLVTGPVSVHRN